MSNHSDLLARFAALQQEAVTGSVAYARRLAKAPRPPYWLNWLGPADYETNSEDELIETRIVTSRLVVAHAEQGYDGEPEDNLYTYITAWLTKLFDAPWLESITYPTGATYLVPNAVIPASDTGMDYFLDVGSPFVMVGIEFNTEVQLVTIGDTT